MNKPKWSITLVLSRQKGSEARRFQSFPLEVDPDEYVLDAVERVWAFHDRSLVFRHACHHSTCGVCGMLVNGVEKLTCITPLRDVTHDGGTLKIEPLRNFPVVSDLAVDMGVLYRNMESAQFNQVAPLEKAHLPYEKGSTQSSGAEFERLVDCIECGLCISACPVALTTPAYLGPAVLAAAQHTCYQHNNLSLLDLIDHQDGLWRCHSAFECTAVCPSHVDPAWRIMELRKRVIGHHIRRVFGKA